MEEFNKKKKNPVKFSVQLNEEQKIAKATAMEHDITIITGKAGTGKTLLATNVALDLLINTYGKDSYESIIILRPLVTADEEVGFLPGDLKNKLDPFLRPVMDNFKRLMRTPSNSKRLDTLFEDGIIEILPIAFSKGITYSNSIVIIDEAEDITKKQMILLLTRLGIGSKMLINGDLNQQDLKGVSGLNPAIAVAAKIERMAHVKLTENHRSSIVKDILNLFDAI